jgi:prepilin-type N-terminal cleavage/methylation domain-containing protein
MSMQPGLRANGFSLVEVIIATLVLTVGLFAAAGSATIVAVQMRSSTWETQRTQVKEGVVEELRAAPYSGVQTRTTPRVVGNFELTWDVTALPLSKRVMLVTTGPGYRAGAGARTQVSDTTSFEILKP